MLAGEYNRCVRGLPDDCTMCEGVPSTVQECHQRPIQQSLQQLRSLAKECVNETKPSEGEVGRKARYYHFQ